MSLAKSLQRGLLVAAAAVLAATPVLAQEPPPVAQAQAQAQAAAAPSAASPYGEAQMRSFARATVDLQLVDPRDVSGQARAIEAAGMSVEQYNQMGDAMRGDPQLASRLNPYLANARAERPAIPGYTPNAYARSYASSYRPAVHHTSSRVSKSRVSKSHARKGKASHASRRGHKASTSRHAKASSHKKAAAHHTTTHRKRHR